MRPLLPVAIALLVLAAPVVAQSSAFPSHAEVTSAVEALAAAEPRLTLLRAGASEEGRALWLVVAADPPVRSPEEVGTRAVSLFYTQQHGNEPGGTPAALAFLEALAGPLGDEVLRDQVILVMPMVNPDGAEKATRGNKDGTDTNRDHMNLTSATARVVHAVVETWRPVLAVDHHEYGGTGLGTGPVYTYDWDATILWPRHANVDPEVVALSVAVNEAMRDRLREAGYSVGDYGTLTLNGIPLADLAGGPTPNIARNHYGLHHAASILVESRVDAAATAPVRGDGAERRIEVHLLTMEAAARHVQANAARALAVRDGAEGRALQGRLAFDDGPTVDFPAWGYRTTDAAALAVLDGHGLLRDADGNVPLAQRLRHHAGLLLDERSDWRIADAEALAAAPLGPGGDAPAEVPDAVLLALVALLAVAVARPVRRR